MQIISINRISQCKSFLVNMKKGLGNVTLMIYLSKEFLMFLQFQRLFFPTLIYIIEDVTANLRELFTVYHLQAALRLERNTNSPYVLPPHTFPCLVSTPLYCLICFR